MATDGTDPPLLTIWRSGTLRLSHDDTEFAETDGGLSPVTSSSRSFLGSGPSIYSASNASAVSFSNYEVPLEDEPLPISDPNPESLTEHPIDEEPPPPYVELAANDDAHVEVNECVQTPRSLTFPSSTNPFPRQGSNVRSASTPSVTSSVARTDDLYIPPSIRRKPLSPRASNGKAREAGYETGPRHDSASSSDSSSSAASVIAPTIIVDDDDSPLFSRDDLSKLFVYAVPYPTPKVASIDAPKAPERFLFYAPLPSFLQKRDGTKESAPQKKLRKLQEDKRMLKEKNISKTTWQNFKAKTRLGFDELSKRTTSSDVDFLARLPMPDKEIKNKDDDVSTAAERRAAQALRELILVYPDSVSSTKEEIQRIFIGAMLKARSRAQRDAAIATGLLPFAAAADLGAGSMGAFTALDSIWAYKSIRCAKTAKALTDRFKKTQGEDRIRFTMKESPRMEIFRTYVGGKCFEMDHDMFAWPGNSSPSKENVLSGIDWIPSTNDDRPLEDREWEVQEAQADLEAAVKKGAKEWTSWCKKYVKDPDRVLKSRVREE